MWTRSTADSLCEEWRNTPHSHIWEHGTNIFCVFWIEEDVLIRTIALLHHSKRGVLLFELALLPLAQHLLLEVSHRFQEVFALHVRGRDDDAAVQELVDAVQEVLPVVRKVGHLVEVLRQNIPRCQPPEWGRKEIQDTHLSYKLPCRTWEWRRSVRSHDSPCWTDWDQARQIESERGRGPRAPTPEAPPRSAGRTPWPAAPETQHSLTVETQTQNVLRLESSIAK